MYLHPAGHPGPGIGRTEGCLWWSSSSEHCPHLSQKQGRPSVTAIKINSLTSNIDLTSYWSTLATQLSAYTEIQHKNKVWRKQNNKQNSREIWVNMIHNSKAELHYLGAVHYKQWYTLITSSLDPEIYIQKWEVKIEIIHNP